MRTKYFNVAKQVGDEGEIHEVSCIESLVENCMHTSFYSDPLESCLVSPIALEYSLNKKIEYLYSLLDTSEMCESSKWAPKFEELPPNKNKILPSNVQPPTLELKVLPSTLKYIFLGEKKTFLVVISSSLDKN